MRFLRALWRRWRGQGAEAAVGRWRVASARLAAALAAVEARRREW